jgi:hypothetical protein
MALQSVVLDSIVGMARDYEAFLRNLKHSKEARRAFDEGAADELEQEKLRSKPGWVGPSPGQCIRQSLIACLERPVDS